MPNIKTKISCHLMSEQVFPDIKRHFPLSRQNYRTNYQHSNATEGASRITLAVSLVAVIAISGILALYALSLGSTSSLATSCNNTTAISKSTVQISILQGAFEQSNAPGYSPDNVTLVIGLNNTVVWQNNDSIHHTVTSSSAPSGASFDSRNIESGSCYIHTFSTPGTYKYYCEYHPWMVGTITVIHG